MASILLVEPILSHGIPHLRKLTIAGSEIGQATGVTGVKFASLESNMTHLYGFVINKDNSVTICILTSTNM